MRRYDILLLDADETGHTSRPGVFASGDVVNGARTVVEAVAHSKVVAESMHQYMQSLKEQEEALKDSSYELYGKPAVKVVKAFYEKNTIG